LYGANVLAWFYMTGEWPALEVDHKNTVKDDNRWDNLRLATRRQNIVNRGPMSKTGLPKGVYHYKNTGNFYVKLWNGFTKRYVPLGIFNNLEAAVTVYTQEAEKLHGEFIYKGTS